MTIHAKNCKPGCIIFLWSFLLRAAGDPPPRDAPGTKSYIYNCGSNMAKMIEGDLRISKICNLIFTIHDIVDLLF